MEQIKVLVFGAGKIGATIADLLAEQADYSVTVADHAAAGLAEVAAAGHATCQVAAEDRAALLAALHGQAVLVNAAPFFLAAPLAAAARQAGCHYFDLTEDLAATRAVRAAAAGANRVFMPQCGLAPGFISIAGYDLARRFSRLDRLHLRVGALPRYPANLIKYNLTWSTAGLVNEYCNPCEAIVDGQRVSLPALDGLERFALDGVDYEAFNTSGGLGSLAETLVGQVAMLDYKSIRYPGHRDLFALLLNELRLRERRELLCELLDANIPSTLQDVVLIFVRASGLRQGRLLQDSFVAKVYGRELAGRMRNAIQLTTAAAVCTAVDLVCSGKLSQVGWLPVESMRLDLFLSNRFGSLYQAAEPCAVC